MQKSVHIMYSLMNHPSVNTYVTSTQIEKQNISKKLEIPCIFLSSYYPLSSQRQPVSWLFLLQRWVLLVFVLRINWIHTVYTCLCLVSWPWHYRLIHIVGWSSSYRLFILFVVYYSMVWICHNLFIHTINDGHLGSF